MAIGDVIFGAGIIDTGGYLVRPPAGQEWVIHNIYYDGGPLVFYITDGTTSVHFDTDTGPGARLGMTTHLTNGYYLRIMKQNAGEVKISFDGVQTK